ncbi:hypothetical protein DBB_8240 [Desulfoluna spongiiphila]|nr:hypothetical protein DBB_8240 [Desulfoluna spongiiphila]
MIQLQNAAFYGYGLMNHRVKRAQEKTKAMPPVARCATSKAGCECDFPFIPQGKSHSPMVQIKLNLFF